MTLLYSLYTVYVNELCFSCVTRVTKTFILTRTNRCLRFSAFPHMTVIVSFSSENDFNLHHSYKRKMVKKSGKNQRSK